MEWQKRGGVILDFANAVNFNIKNMEKGINACRKIYKISAGKYA